MKTEELVIRTEAGYSQHEWYGPISEVAVGNRLVVCQQREGSPSRQGKWGTVYGYKASERYTNEDSVPAMKVEIIPEEEKEPVREALCDKLQGPLNFW